MTTIQSQTIKVLNGKWMQDDIARAHEYTFVSAMECHVVMAFLVWFNIARVYQGGAW